MYGCRFDQEGVTKETGQISTAAKQYPIYYREMTGLAEGYAYAAFSREVPWTEYVQAIPEIMLLINDMKCVPFLLEAC